MGAEVAVKVTAEVGAEVWQSNRSDCGALLLATHTHTHTDKQCGRTVVPNIIKSAANCSRDKQPLELTHSHCLVAALMR